MKASLSSTMTWACTTLYLDIRRVLCSRSTTHHSTTDSAVKGV